VCSDFFFYKVDTVCGISYRKQIVLKFEEHRFGVAQAVSELATLFPEVSNIYSVWVIDVGYTVPLTLAHMLAHMLAIKKSC